MNKAPLYLSKYLINQIEKKDVLILRIGCECGCSSFRFLENFEDKETEHKEKKLMSMFAKTNERYIDPDTKAKYFVKRNIFGKIKIKIPESELDNFGSARIVKAVCTSCKREIILFDSRYHGYDAVVGNKQNLDKNRQYQYREMANQIMQLEIELLQDIPYDEFLDEFGLELAENYSNAFSYITIYGLDEKGRRHRLFEEETE